MKKQIFKNVLSNYIVTLIGICLGFLVIPFLIQRLGKDAFGLIVLAESTIAFFEIVTISIRMALSRHATYALSQGKKNEFIEYLSTGRYILLVSVALVFLAGLLLSYNFPNIFRVPSIYAMQSKILFLLITIAFSITVLNIVFWSVLYAKQRFDLINVSSSTGFILRALSIFLFYSILPKRYVSLITYGFIYLAMICMQNYMVYRWHKKVIPGIKISIKHFRHDKIRKILSFSVHASLSQIGSLLYMNTANILINIFWGPAFNAIYMVSLKLPFLIHRLFGETTWVLTPTFTDLAAKNDKKKLESLFFMYSKLVSIITIPLSLILIFMAKPIISFWVGDEFILASKILPIHMLSLLVTIPAAVTACIINAYAKVKIPSRVNFGGGILNILLIIILVKVFSLGLFGIAIAMAVSTFLVSALFYTYYVCKISGISFKKYWIESFIKPFIWACIIMGGCFLLIDILQLGIRLTLPLLIIVGASLFVCYLGGYLFILKPAEKDNINELFKLLLNAKRG